ncbi:hypothetical protein TGDOM2_399490, partial [Toxoplasma gondii GAB2-2007-GAL-DOM2]
MHSTGVSRPATSDSLGAGADGRVEDSFLILELSTVVTLVELAAGLLLALSAGRATDRLFGILGRLLTSMSCDDVVSSIKGFLGCSTAGLARGTTPVPWFALVWAMSTVSRASPELKVLPTAPALVSQALARRRPAVDVGSGKRPLASLGIPRVTIPWSAFSCTGSEMLAFLSSPTNCCVPRVLALPRSVVAALAACTSSLRFQDDRLKPSTSADCDCERGEALIGISLCEQDRPSTAFRSGPHSSITFLALQTDTPAFSGPLPLSPDASIWRDERRSFNSRETSFRSTEVSTGASGSPLTCASASVIGPNTTASSLPDSAPPDPSALST